MPADIGPHQDLPYGQVETANKVMHKYGEVFA
jgi:hypothetical protein